MRKLFLSRVFVATAAVLVIGPDGGVVVSGHAGNPVTLDEVYRLVRPGGISYKVAKMIGRGHIQSRAYISENSFERW
jgi:hypothetical protein